MKAYSPLLEGCQTRLTLQRGEAAHRAAPAPHPAEARSAPEKTQRVGTGDLGVTSHDLAHPLWLQAGTVEAKM